MRSSRLRLEPCAPSNATARARIIIEKDRDRATGSIAVKVAIGYLCIDAAVGDTVTLYRRHDLAGFSAPPPRALLKRYGFGALLMVLALLIALT
jgi:hypothetical protein